MNMPCLPKPDRRPYRPGLLMWSAGQRLTAATAVLTALWLAVAWAMAA